MHVVALALCKVLSCAPTFLWHTAHQLIRLDVAVQLGDGLTQGLCAQADGRGSRLIEQ